MTQDTSPTADAPTADDPAAADSTQEVEGERLGVWRRFLTLPPALRWTAYVAVALVLVLIAGLVAGTVVVRRAFPQTDGTLQVEGLSGEVEVIRDARGIPQIYADSVEDLMLAQGFVHAQERFFEMDVRRHATAGRLAEMFGEDAVESDAYVRTMGWRRVAEQELKLLRPETRVALDAYARGVNAYLQERSGGALALEYAVLGLGGLDYQPEPWNAIDSLAWLKAMAWDLRGNMTDEIQRALTTAEVGSVRAAQLFPGYAYPTPEPGGFPDDPAEGNAPVVNQGAVIDGVFQQNATENDTRNPVRPPTGTAYGQGQALRALRRTAAGLSRMPAWLGRGDGLGSNSWVLSGDHTTTGAPLLANDPHLGVSMPGVWTPIGLHCRTVSPECPYDVAGFSFSGVPGVIIGHNADIAWGLTNLPADVTDLFVERISEDTWRRGGQQRPLRTRTETIRVADGDDVELTIRSTAHGPLISDVDDDVGRVISLQEETDEGDEGGATTDEEIAIALSWTALQPAPTADAILALNRASDWTSFRAALSDLAAPAQNVVYADREGHIGYQATGRIPIRQPGNDGLMPVDGTRRNNDWTGEYVPYDGLPSLLDPASGQIVAANQPSIGPDYPYYLTSDWDRGDRAARIRELLAERDVSSLADAVEMQLDDRHPFAPLLSTYLAAVELPGGYYSDGQKLLADWDFDQPADSAAAAYYNVVWRNLLQLTFHDELPEAAWPDGGQRWMGVVADLLTRPDDEWWDDVETEVVERRDQILRQAMLDARDELTGGRRSTPRSGAGAPCTSWSSPRRRSGSPASGWWSDSSTARAGRRRAVEAPSTRLTGTPARATR